MRALRVGLTGGIGAGKSLALAEFARLGATAIDTDEIAREQAKKGGAAYGKIVKAFGRSILKADGSIDRQKLGERVFKRPVERKRLERITHPLVRKETARRLQAAKDAVAIVAVPLLFEAGMERDFDVTLTIEAPAATRRRRVVARDAVAAAAVGARMRAQLSEVSRRRKADVAIRNDGAKRIFLRTIRSYYKGLELLRHGAAVRVG